jgi:hypothetical protein
VGNQKKTLVLNLGSPPEKGGKPKKNPRINLRQSAGKGRETKKKKPGINPGQPIGKGWETKKKTLVLTLGSLPEKGGKPKKNPGINPRQPARKGRKTKKKKTWY